MSGNKNYDIIKWASLRSEELSRRIEAWNSVKEIRRWREKRK